MGLKNPLFRIDWMFAHDDELDPRQNTKNCKLIFRQLPPVGAALKGDAVDPVEKVPAGVRYAFR